MADHIIQVPTPQGDMTEANRLAALGWRVAWANVNDQGECLSVIMERARDGAPEMEIKEHDNGA